MKSESERERERVNASRRVFVLSKFSIKAPFLTALFVFCCENNFKQKIFISTRTFLVVMFLFSVLTPKVFATTSGPLGPGTMATSNASGGATDWTTPNNAKVEDGSVAYAIVGSSPTSLAPDTIISTKKGNKAIKDLKAGDLVYSYNLVSGKIELKEASNIINVPIAQDGNKYYHIYFESGDIRATYNHFFYVDDKLVMAKDLKIGDELSDINGKKQPITKIIIEENYTDYVWDISVDDNQNFFANGVLVHNSGVYDHRARIIKSGAIGSTDKASGTAWPGTLAYTTYGSSSDFWGETGWTAEIINASDFGVAISAYGSGYAVNSTTYYLNATNFGFSIPTGVTINGITVEIKKQFFFNGGAGLMYARIDHIRITVDYTADATNPTVSTLSPADNTTAVGINDNLVITFSEAVDAEAGADNDIVIKKTSDNSTIETIDAQDAKVTGSGTTIITVNPAATLSGQTSYYVQIGADAFDDAASNSFAGIADATTWNFTTADITSPTISGGLPSGTQNAWTTSVTISATTDENATCKYSSTSGTAFALMTVFTTTDTTSHSTSISGLNNGSNYSYYVLCQDSSNNESAETTISFSIAFAGGSGGGMPIAWYNPPAAYNPPVTPPEIVNDTILNTNRDTNTETENLNNMTQQQKTTLIAQIKQQLIALITQLIQMLYLQVRQMGG